MLGNCRMVFAYARDSRCEYVIAATAVLRVLKAAGNCYSRAAAARTISMVKAYARAMRCPYTLPGRAELRVEVTVAEILSQPAILLSTNLFHILVYNLSAGTSWNPVTKILCYFNVQLQK